MSRLARVAVIAVVLLLVAACRPDTSVTADQRSVVNAYVRIDGVDAHYSGQIGLDLLMGDNHNPCHQHFDEQGGFNDTTYAACQDSSLDRVSYAKHISYGAGARFAGELVWSNIEPNHCAGQPWCTTTANPVQTLWANRATGWALEFYPDNSWEGGVRVSGDLPEIHGASAVSPALGTIRLPRIGDPATTYVYGLVIGAPAHTFEIDAFQMPPFTLTTTTGYPEGGFSAARNDPGSYHTGVVPHGGYHIVVTDLVSGYAVGINRLLYSPYGGDRIDIDPNAPCFGLGVAYAPFTGHQLC